jgi:glycosyltransferase involved in cell wall biosynthesis
MSRNPDLICFSHLRWGFVFQRPNHLMSACSRQRRVFFMEEPMGWDGPSHLDVREALPGLFVVTPRLDQSLDEAGRLAAHRAALNELVERHGIDAPIAWFYTPMALDFARDLRTSLVVYDVMDELSAFRFAPPRLAELERELFALADVVFTGGPSLFESKRHAHTNVHLFPSGVDAAHYRRARQEQADPDDQRGLARPRLGYFGVIDERIDLELLERVAAERPDFQLVLVGPVVKIDPATLPRRRNIHYLGQKTYEELPHYLAGWQVAIMPFALNEATRFISPTKTLEYLAGGKPVVSTPVRDVVTPYGRRGLVEIGDSESFIAAVERALATNTGDRAMQIERILLERSWESTWVRMSSILERTLRRQNRNAPATLKELRGAKGLPEQPQVRTGT